MTRLRLYYVRFCSLVIAMLIAAVVAGLVARIIERQVHFPFRAGFYFVFFPCTYFLYRLIFADPFPAVLPKDELNAMNDFARRIAALPIDVVREVVAGILANPELRSHREDDDGEPMTFETVVPPAHLRELFARDPLIHLHRICRIGAALLRPSRYAEGFFRVGKAGPTETSELAFRPGEETIFELDPHSTSAGPFNLRNRFPSFYHWLWFQFRVFRCPCCGYNLLADPDHCPECGQPNPNVPRPAS